MPEPCRHSMGFEEYTSNPVFMTNLVCIIVFAIAFPGYFAIMADDEGSAGAGASSTPGDWIVSFNQTQETFEESVNMGDNSQHDSIFMGNFDTSVEIASIEATFICDDNDDGPGQGNARDSIMVDSDTSGVSGTQEEQSGESNCGGQGGGGVVFFWEIVSNYTGSGYIAEGKSMDDIRAEWDDGDESRGEWKATVNMDVASGVNPLFQDGDEDVDITWTITYFVVEFEPAPPPEA